MDKLHLDWPAVACCMGDDGCVCGPMERALRGWSASRAPSPMSAEQREACLDEIGRVEGYERATHEGDDDTQLANTVLSAWTDYCRDKGLL